MIVIILEAIKCYEKKIFIPKQIFFHYTNFTNHYNHSKLTHFNNMLTNTARDTRVNTRRNVSIYEDCNNYCLQGLFAREFSFIIRIRMFIVQDKAILHSDK